MRIVGLIVIVALGLGGRAQADTAPWSVGITDAQKDQAKVELDAGNALFLDKKYSEALARYQAAIAAWDHPAIRFNIVRCLIQLDRAVDATDNLKLALKYGAAPLEEAVYTEALAYEKLLAKQIGELVVACKQSDVTLTLDGQPLGKCPIEERRRVAPGPHQVVGVRDGYFPRTLDIIVVGGGEQRVAVALEPLTKVARIEHRMATWIPWVVFGSGFAVAAIGGAIDLSAASEMSRYDREVRTLCSVQACMPGDPERTVPDEGIREAAERRSAIGVGIMIVGAATVTTGAVLLYMNRGRTVYPRGSERIAPTLTPTTGGATLGLARRF